MELPQVEAQKIRNLCIIAHVDHGKTTLTDSLIASNGIISEKLAGKIRYMDSTEEEQLRGITMESSAISIIHQADIDDPYLFNLIDSPGHVDFSSDVSTAVRLCDGALLLVDVVEGVCAQTHAVLRQAWKERVKPCLVLNKMDRLITELQMSPSEAYQHICRVIELVNVTLSSMIQADLLQADDARESSSDSSSNWFLSDDIDSAEQVFFNPMAGNVVFASAADGWAFGVGYFAQFFAKKLDVPMKLLRRGLWGDYVYVSSSKSIKAIKHTNTKAVPMFVSMVLTPLWEVYNAAQLSPDPEKLQVILKTLRIAKHLTSRDLKYSDKRLTLQAVMRKWLPLSSAVFRMVIRCLPSPKQAQAIRVERLLPSNSDKKMSECYPVVYPAMATCTAENDDCPTVAFVSKMMSVDSRLLSDYSPGSEEKSDSEILVGFCRVFCGTLRSNDASYYVLDPAYDSKSTHHSHNVSSTELKFYRLMGRELVRMSSVSAGDVCGIVGLEPYVMKTATITSTLECPALCRMPYQAKPVVRVAIEPENPFGLQALQEGLAKLYRADPTVEVLVQESGEHVIVTLGELHLERCISDLKTRFGKVPIRVSEPIVSFRETIVSSTEGSSISVAQQKMLLDQFAVTFDASDNQVAKVSTADGTVTLVIRCEPYSLDAVKLIEEHEDLLRSVTEERDDDTENPKFEKFKASLVSLLQLQDETQQQQNLWCLGPKRVGTNLLVNEIPSWNPKSNFFDITLCEEEDNGSELLKLLDKIENSLVTGFQSAVASGPLCEEPISGVKFIIQDVITDFCDSDEDSSTSTTYGPLSGQVISAMKKACRQAFLLQPVRLVEPIYHCQVQCSSEHLGKCYSVISKRRGNVLSEELVDGSSLFVIEADLPVIESFGFSSDLLSNTSGCASSPQLTFSRYQICELDPFFQPSTVEERETHGDRVYESNAVRKYIETIRKRKGLAVDEKLVVHAEKQRTLTRSK